MGSKQIFITAFIILGTSIIISIFISTNYSPQVSAYPELEKCNSLKFNGEEKINLVFFSTKEQAELYSETLFSTKPFSENQEVFNVFYIDSYIPDCKIYKDVALFCHSSELVKKSASCPNDFIFVLQDIPESIRSSAYLNVGSLNTNHPKSVIIHEFGHLFANLAEEYVPAIPPFNSKNCVSKCSSFGEKENNCFEGCSKSSLFRSSENSVMRTLHSQEYGEFNSQLINSKINKYKSSKITGSAINTISNCYEQTFLLVRGKSHMGEFSITSTSLESGCSPKISSGDFRFETSNNLREFNPAFIFTESQLEEQEAIAGNVFEAENTEFTISISNFQDSDELKIYNSQSEIIIRQTLMSSHNQLCKLK